MTKIEYRNTLNKIFWPLLITYVLTNSFSLIDSAMLSWYNNDMASGVNTASYLQTLVGPILFGLLAGVGIYGSQYFGAKDYVSLKKTFGLSMTLSIIFSIIFFTFIGLFGDWFIELYGLESNDIVDNAKIYMNYLKYFYLIFPINFAFTFGFRITKRANIGMYSNIAKGILNMSLNYLLIFGNFGAPEMGIEGAAIATIISQVSILVFNIIAVIVIKPEFFGKLSEMFIYDINFIKPILLRAMPIVISEGMFGMARFAYSYAFAQISDGAFTADAYANKISFIIGSCVMATANTCSIMMGAELGNGDMVRVKQLSKRLIAFIVRVSIIVLVLSAIIGPFIVQPIFQIEDPELLKNIQMMTIVGAVFTSLRVISSSILFILRAGGDTLYSLLIDSGMAWIIGVPITLLVAFTMPVDPITLKMVTLTESFSKSSLAYFRFKSGKWINNLVSK